MTEPGADLTPFEQFEQALVPLAGELLTQPAAAAVAAYARMALRLQVDEIARLKAQLDRYTGRTVYHCTQDQAEMLLGQLGGSSPPGTILRATDTGREWELRETGQGGEPGLWELVTT